MKIMMPIVVILFLSIFSCQKKSDLFRWMFDGLKTVNDMVNRYNKEVMTCEIGIPMSDSVECKKFITDLISKTKSMADHKGLDVFYWEPECYNNRYGYGLGAFNTNGQPTIALDAFK